MRAAGTKRGVGRLSRRCGRPGRDPRPSRTRSVSPSRFFSAPASAPRTVRLPAGHRDDLGDGRTLGAAEHADEQRLLGALAGLARPGRRGAHGALGGGRGPWSAGGATPASTAATAALPALMPRTSRPAAVSAAGRRARRRHCARDGSAPGRLRRRSPVRSSASPRTSSAATALVAAPPRNAPGIGSRLPSARCAAVVSRIDCVGNQHVHLPQLRNDFLGLVLPVRHSWHPPKAESLLQGGPLFRGQTCSGRAVRGVQHAIGDGVPTASISPARTRSHQKSSGAAEISSWFRPAGPLGSVVDFPQFTMTDTETAGRILARVRARGPFWLGAHAALYPGTRLSTSSSTRWGCPGSGCWAAPRR